MSRTISQRFLNDSDDDQPMLSPMSCKSTLAPATVELQLQQFLDEWHFRILHSSLGRRWNRKKVIATLIELLMLNGVLLNDEDILYALKLDEKPLVKFLVERFPMYLLDHFEHLAMQIQLVVQMLTRVRRSLEANDDAEVRSVIEEGYTSGVGEVLLKQAVVRASQEIATIFKCQETWVADTQDRIERLLQGAEHAEHCNRKLMAIEAQLGSIGGSAKAKSKKVLLSMADSDEKTLRQSSFTAWLGLALNNKADRALREKFEKRISDAETTLFKLKEHRFTNVRSMIQHKASEHAGGLLMFLFRGWCAEVQHSKDEVGTKAELAAMQAKLAASKSGQAEATKRLLTRMSADREESLLGMCFQGLMQYVQEYRKEKEFEDQVKAAEVALQAHLASKKEDVKKLLDRMSHGTETGLLSSTVRNWRQATIEDKKEREIEDQLMGGDTKMKSLQSRQVGNARNVQGRVNEQMDQNMLTRVLNHWVVETKVNSINRRMDTTVGRKRKQLESVNSLFKSFTKQLDEGLGNIDGDSSARNHQPRRHDGHRGDRRHSSTDPQKRPASGRPMESPAPSNDPQKRPASGRPMASPAPSNDPQKRPASGRPMASPAPSNDPQKRPASGRPMQSPAPVKAGRDGYRDTRELPRAQSPVVR